MTNEPVENCSAGPIDNDLKNGKQLFLDQKILLMKEVYLI